MLLCIAVAFSWRNPDFVEPMPINMTRVVANLSRAEGNVHVYLLAKRT